MDKNTGTDGVSGKQFDFEGKDVSELLMHVYNGSTQESRKKIIEEAVRIGHAQLLISAYIASQEAVPGKDIHNALTNAVPMRGFSIDDKRTSVGMLYQILYGEDFREMEIPCHDGVVRKYDDLNSDVKKMVNKIVLANKEYYKLEMQ